MSTVKRLPALIDLALIAVPAKRRRGKASSNLREPREAEASGISGNRKWKGPKVVSQVIFATAALLAVTTTGCGHGARTVPPPSHAAAQPGGPDASLERLIGTNLSAHDRAILLAMAQRMPAAVRSRATQSNTTLAVAIIDARGRIARQFSNRPNILIGPDTRVGKVVQSTHGARVAPGKMVPRNANRVASAIPVLPGLGTGPYHTLLSQTGLGSGNYAGVNAPCNATVNGGDVPYFALGGSTNQPSSQVEAGAELIIDADPAKSVYVPYFRYAGGSGLILYPGNAGTLTNTSAQSGTGDGTTFVCGSNQSMQIELSFGVQTAISLPNSDPLQPVTLFTSVLSTDAGAVIFGLVFPTQNWQNWIGLPPTGTTGCTQCYYYQTTSIALANSDNGAIGDSYGPVKWSGMGIQFDYGATSPVAYSECLNYPAWSSVVNECGNTPADPLDGTIQVANQSIDNNSGTDDVSIGGGPQLQPQQDAKLETSEFPSDAPAYVFVDPNVDAGPVTDALRRRVTSVAPGVIPIPCPPANARIDVRTAGSITLTNDATCPPGSIIDAIYAQTKTFDFNAQHTPTSSPAPVSKSCGGNTCSASFVISVAGTGIVEVNSWYTAHFPTQRPVTSPYAGFSIPFNNLGQAYPQEQDTRYAGATKPVPFPAPPPMMQACPQNASIPKAGCSYRSDKPLGVNFAADLRTAYDVNKWDTTIFKSSDLQAHHIQPLCWGGANDVNKNGVYLRKANHQRYTSWWGRTRISGETCDVMPATR